MSLENIFWTLIFYELKVNKNIFKLSTKCTIHKSLKKIDQVNYMKNILSL